jgi:hypothetical protein
MDELSAETTLEIALLRNVKGRVVTPRDFRH